MNSESISTENSSSEDLDDKEHPILDIDEKKVNVAVRFLANKNVRNTTTDRKVKFLKSKGLTEDEIDLSLKKTEDFATDYEVESTSSWSAWDYLKGIVLGAGILSSANYAYKAYILPYVAHEIKEDARIEALKESVQYLKDDLKQNTYEFTCTLKSIQSLLEEQKVLLTNIDIELKKPERNASSMENIKGDLAILKGMMLSKNQFPAAPFSSTTTAAEIPAWQKATEKNVDGEETNAT